jgi:hypothetical protein
LARPEPTLEFFSDPSLPSAISRLHEAAASHAIETILISIERPLREGR